MKTFWIYLIMLCFALFSSCAIHSGYLNNSASLSQGNFHYSKFSISGTASTTYVFGIGGLRKRAIVEEAKRDMLEKNPLKSNQVLANTTVNWKFAYFLIISKLTCTVTGDVVEFDSVYNENELKLEMQNGNTKTRAAASKSINMEEGNNIEPVFKVGDKVVYQDTFNKYQCTIFQIDEDHIYIRYKDKKGNEKTRITTATWLKKVD